VYLPNVSLYETQYHAALLQTFKDHLAPNGQVFMMNPLRGESFTAFHDLARNAGFIIDIKERYSDVVWKRHAELLLEENGRYNPDKEYPLLSILQYPRSLRE
jgi:hypothetical protein